MLASVKRGCFVRVGYDRVGYVSICVCECGKGRHQVYLPFCGMTHTLVADADSGL